MNTPVIAPVKKLLLLLFLPALVMGQTPTPTPDTPSDRGVWRAELPGGTFVVALTAITSVSSHEYVVDNTTRVTEVTVATIGSVIGRFYYLEPNTPEAPGGIGQSTINFVQDKVTEAADRTGSDLWKKVVKSYPTSTHAHTVEYRLESKQSLQKLYKGVETAWLRGRGATFKP
ncbi:MAG: hypothetical protein ACOYM3_11270 [Terrimicrobiaceae bacterium]